MFNDGRKIDFIPYDNGIYNQNVWSTQKGYGLGFNSSIMSNPHTYDSKYVFFIGKGEKSVTAFPMERIILNRLAKEKVIIYHINSLDGHNIGRFTSNEHDIVFGDATIYTILMGLGETDG